MLQLILLPQLSNSMSWSWRNVQFVRGNLILVHTRSMFECAKGFSRRKGSNLAVRSKGAEVRTVNSDRFSLRALIHFLSFQYTIIIQGWPLNVYNKEHVLSPEIIALNDKMCWFFSVDFVFYFNTRITFLYFKFNNTIICLNGYSASIVNTLCLSIN